MEETISVLHVGLISGHFKCEEISQIHFSVIIFHLTNHEGKAYTLEENALTKTMEIFILEVNS